MQTVEIFRKYDSRKPESEHFGQLSRYYGMQVEMRLASSPILCSASFLGRKSGGITIKQVDWSSLELEQPQK